MNCQPRLRKKIKEKLNPPSPPFSKGGNRAIKEGVSLKNFTTFMIGGKARFYIKPRSIAELRSALKFARHHKLKIFVLGAGSNLLISDDGVRGLVIHLTDSFFAKVSIDGAVISAGAGIKLNKLLSYAGDNCLSGLEFSAGIPGTLGGALLMNAGAWGENFGDKVAEVKIMDYNARIKIIKKTRIKFAYRKSNLSKFIILSAKLKLIRGKNPQIASKINEYLSLRKLAQESRSPNAGCIFKNPKNNSAGKLIDSCGLKGEIFGGAAISEKHANFIVNYKNASCVDVLSLIEKIKSSVKSKFGQNLSLEIKIWQ